MNGATLPWLNDSSHVTLECNSTKLRLNRLQISSTMFTAFTAYSIKLLTAIHVWRPAIARESINPSHFVLNRLRFKCFTPATTSHRRNNIDFSVSSYDRIRHSILSFAIGLLYNANGCRFDNSASQARDTIKWLLAYMPWKLRTLLVRSLRLDASDTYTRLKTVHLKDM